MAAPPTCPPPPPTNPPEDQWVMDWGEFKAVITNAHEETTRRLQPLRSFQSWSVSNPWNGFIAVVFDSKKNAEHAASVLGSMAMTSTGGHANKLEARIQYGKANTQHSYRRWHHLIRLKGTLGL